jgi:hypothetical protein
MEREKSILNADGSMDTYLGPKSPGADKNWLATIPAALVHYLSCLRPFLVPAAKMGEKARW